MDKEKQKKKGKTESEKDGGKIRKKGSGNNQLIHSSRVVYDIRIKLNQYHNQLQYYYASIIL